MFFLIKRITIIKKRKLIFRIISSGTIFTMFVESIRQVCRKNVGFVAVCDVKY